MPEEAHERLTEPGAALTAARHEAAAILGAAHEESAALIAGARAATFAILDHTRAEAARLLSDATGEAQELARRVQEAELQLSATASGGRPAQTRRLVEAQESATPSSEAMADRPDDTLSGEPLIGSRGHGVRAPGRRAGGPADRTTPPE